MDDKKLKHIIRKALISENNDVAVSPDDLSWNDFFELLELYKIKFEPLMVKKIKTLYFPPKRKEKIKQNIGENIPLANGPDFALNEEFTSKLNGLIEEYLRNGIEVKYIRAALNNAMNSVEGKAVSMVQAGLSEEAQNIDEERITNDEGKEFAKRKENFIGSHCWGESLGDGSYVVMSYGKQFPLYVFWNKKNKWYENADHYIFNGEPQESTEEHRRDLRPTDETRKKPADWMRKLSAHLLKVNGIKDYEHISVEPGTKN